MYANFPVAIFQKTCGKRIVKVFGIFRVDGESRDITEVFTFGYFLFGDCFRYLIRRFFHIGRIFVWEVELCEDCVHLGIVVTGRT